MRYIKRQKQRKEERERERLQLVLVVDLSTLQRGARVALGVIHTKLAIYTKA